MPIVRIEDATLRPLADQQLLIEGLYTSLKEHLGVSNEELQARYYCLPPQCMRTPGDRDAYIQITITLFRGRTTVTKRKLYADIVERLWRILAIEPASVVILLDEHDAENWGMRGGVPACDIDFGYTVRV